MRKFIALALLGTSVFAADTTVLSWNIDTNVARSEGANGLAIDTFPNWRANARAESIQDTLSKISLDSRPDLLFFQEGRDFSNNRGDRVDSVTPLKDYLESLGYKTHVQTYNETGDLTFQYITAWNPKRYGLLKMKVSYLTKTPNLATQFDEKVTPENKDNNFGELFERCVPIYKLQDKTGGKTVFAINSHLYLGYNARIESSKLLNKIAESLSRHSDAAVIMAGDFNTFPDWGGADMIKEITAGDVLTDATADLRLNGQPFNSSIALYPFDYGSKEGSLKSETNALNDQSRPVEERRSGIWRLYAEQSPVLGGVLDHVFVRGLSPLSAEVRPVPLYTDIDAPADYTVESVRDYVLRGQTTGTPAFASDHMPLLVKLKGK